MHPVILVEALGIDEPGGGRTAVLFLLDAVARLCSHWRFVVLLSRRERLLDEHCNVRQIILPARRGPWARLVAQFAVPIIALMIRADLVHFAKSQASWVWRVKTVLTLFDLTTLRQPQWHSRWAVWYWRYIQPHMARRADAIITLSQHAAQDIAETFHVAADRLTVVPCAPQPLESGDLSELPELPKRFILFVGMIAHKKNLATLIRAIALLEQQYADPVTLVIAGPRYRLSDGSSVLGLTSELKIERRVLYLGSISSSVLHHLYSNATLFVMPSTHEGFGIPSIEAMKCGVPVIAARASALPEIVGDAGLLIDDFLSPHAWAAAIAGLLDDKHWREVLAARGRQRAQSFTWEASARLLAGVHARLLGVIAPA
jgi:glycosyltransferase involved in cell wall biosynthesis